MGEEDVTFYTSHGQKLSGMIFVPDDYKVGQKRAAIVNVGGISAVYHMGYYLAISRDLCKAGYIVVSFDFRGFGKSASCDGQYATTMWEEVEDVRNAITYLQSRPEVDPEKIGLVGNSVGGAVVTYAAAIDERAKATISNWGLGDGERWFKTNLGAEDWNGKLKEIEEDRKERVRTGKSRRVPYTHFYQTKAAAEDQGRDGFEKQGWIGGTPTITYFESIKEFKPERVVHMISPRAIFIVHAQAEKNVLPLESESLYDNAKEPKKLWLIPESMIPSEDWFPFVVAAGDRTYGRDNPGLLRQWEEMMEKEVSWLKQYIPPL